MVKINSTTIIALIIVILFVGSMIASSALVGNRARGNINNDSNSTNTPNPEDYKQYIASFDSNVLQIFPKLIITAKPTNYDNTVIEDKLKHIPNVEDVSVNFTSDENKNVLLISNLTYDENKEDVIKNLKDINILNELKIYQYGLLEIPKNINFKLINDQNITKDYYFAGGKAEGLLNVGTIQDDKIRLQAQAVFANDKLYRLSAIEVENLSAAPQIIEDTKTYPIESWNNTYLINTTTGFSNTKDFNKLFDYNYTVNTNINNYLKYDLNNIEIKEDLNNTLNSIKDLNNSYLEDYLIDTNKDVLNIYFKPNIDYNTYYNFKDMLNNNFNLDSNKILLDLKKAVNFNINDSIDINSTIELLKENNLNIENIKRSANILVNDLNINNKIYTYDENITQVNIEYPINKDVKQLEFDLTAGVRRNKIVLLILNEHKEIEENK
jgi:hypothetical protein